MVAELINKRLELFPISTTYRTHPGLTSLEIGGCLVNSLADQFGTPLYAFDCQTLDSSVQAYRSALKRYYPASSELTYAGKAYLSLAIAQWAEHHRLFVDCTGCGEMQVAVAAAVRRPHILVHGVNKSQEDLEMAIRTAGVIVVDNLAELKRLVVLRQLVEQDFPSLWLRLRPGLPVNTHSFTQTGQLDSKFGFDFEEASTAIALALQAHLPLRGLHFHQGSHFHDPQPVGQAMRAVVQFIQDVRNAHHWIPEVICPGGGWGVAYHEDDLPQPDIADYIRTVANELIQGWQALDLPLPRLQFEPGRSLVARAGVSLYRVGAVKITPHRRWVLIDGGMADNPRPALYGARYSALPVNYPQAGDWAPAWIAGPYCESGDVLIENLPLPDIFPGELLAIPVSGAYHLSMGSNYNGARKPAVVWLDSGRAALIQAREKLDDLLHRDMRLPLELLHS